MVIPALWRNLGTPLLVAVALAACTDARTATTPGELYHCSGDGDCLSGWSCVCGYCQQPGALEYVCTATSADVADDASLLDAEVVVAAADSGGDGGPADGGGSETVAGADAASDGANDTAVDSDAASDSGTLPAGTPIGICGQTIGTDTLPGPCGLDDWTQCPAGYGCYYGPAIKQSLCKQHGSLGENAACVACNLSECGLASDKRPLLCDAILQQCLRSCNCQNVKKLPCPSGQTCYCLTESATVKFPNGAGICAP